ncbi:MAG: condensin complex non-SMC subunit Cnd2 [Amphiamblys sp. WSBS2006]|nr:MAG: condensin complex non-SMC subunit Cnd2 [Amphiamblys sp. WSBS2006]
MQGRKRSGLLGAIRPSGGAAGRTDATQHTPTKGTAPSHDTTPVSVKSKERFAKMTVEQINKTFEDWMKIAAENKITAKNSWSLSLIDYFSEVRFLKDNQNEINFQKASCTLDGCVKVYASRVDSMADEAGRLLVGLADTQEPEKKEARKKTISTKRKFVEKNTGNILLRKSEISAPDQLFKKMSAGTGKTGTKEIHLANFHPTRGGGIVFDIETEPFTDRTAPHTDDSVADFPVDTSSLLDKIVCPEIDAPVFYSTAPQETLARIDVGMAAPVDEVLIENDSGDDGPLPEANSFAFESFLLSPAGTKRLGSVDTAQFERAHWRVKRPKIKSRTQTRTASGQLDFSEAHVSIEKILEEGSSTMTQKMLTLRTQKSLRKDEKFEFSRFFFFFTEPSRPFGGIVKTPQARLFDASQSATHDTLDDDMGAVEYELPHQSGQQEISIAAPQSRKTKVNVKQLKEKIKNEIKGGGGTLTALVDNMRESCPDVSSAHCFICLLHLAGEMELDLDQPRQFEDLYISSKRVSG